LTFHHENEGTQYHVSTKTVHHAMVLIK